MALILVSQLKNLTKIQINLPFWPFIKKKEKEKEKPSNWIEYFNSTRENEKDKFLIFKK